MMVALGNFLFRYRNALFPIAYLELLLPGRRVFTEQAVSATLGLLVAVLGQTLRALTIGMVYIRRGGRKRRVSADDLVEDGMFAHCRNPLYVGNFLILAGLGLIANSVLFLSVGLGFFFLAYWAIIAAEEQFLEGKFRQEYRAYCSRVPRIIPIFAGFSATWRKHKFNWRRLIVKEYGSTFIWVGGSIILIGKEQLLSGSGSRHPPLFPGVLLLCAIAVFAVARFVKKSRLLVPE